MTQCRSLSFVILLTIAVAGCSKQSSPPAATTAPAAAAPASTLPPPATPPAQTAAPGTALKTGDTNISGIAADVTECSRKEGVLTVRVRFRNTSGTKRDFNLIENRNFEQYYVTAANKKYFILKDTEGTYLTPQANIFGKVELHLESGEQYTWWAKYPAPPAEVKAVTLYTPVAAPLEDIPVSDR